MEQTDGGHLLLRLTALLTGAAALALAYSYPWAWAGCFLALALLWASAASSRSAWRAFLWGWLGGIVVHLLGFTWIAHTLRVFGGLGWGLAILGLFLFALGSGLTFGVWAAAVHAGRRHLSLAAWTALPMAYVPLEWLVPKLFPWHLGAPLLHLEALVQIADVTGAWGLSFLAAMVSGALVDVWEAARRARQRGARTVPSKAFTGLVVSLAAIVATSVYGLYRLRQMDRLLRRAHQEGRIVTVGIVQPNIGSFEKEDPAKADEQLRRMAELSRKAVARGAQLVVWPETAIRYPVSEEAALAEVQSGGRPGHPPAIEGQPGLQTAWLLAGGILEGRRGDENAVFLIGPEGGVAGVTSKRVLLMFGEYLPFEERLPWLRRYFPRAGRLVPGRRPKVLDWFGVRLGILICYEAILPAQVRSVVRGGANVLVNLTNDSWFGPTREPDQHLLLAALRTVETRRALIRATNTGKSALIDPAGRVLVKTDLFRPAVLVREVPLLAGQTFFVRHGPWLPLLLSLLWPAAALAEVVRRFRSRGSPGAPPEGGAAM